MNLQLLCAGASVFLSGCLAANPTEGLSIAPLPEPVAASSVKRITVTLGETPVHIDVKRSGQGPVFVSLHDDENTALTAAKGLRGTHITLSHTGRRNVSFILDNAVYSFDPNRIFSDGGIRLTLKQHKAYSAEAHAAVKALADQLRALIGSGGKVIGLHNNSDKLYSVKSYKSNNKYFGEAKDVFVSPTHDEDDFILTTSPGIYDRVVKLGYNAVLQSERPTDDGSLSVYCTKHCGVYINVEAQHGHVKEQAEMLRAVLQ